MLATVGDADTERTEERAIQKISEIHDLLLRKLVLVLLVSSGNEPQSMHSRALGSGTTPNSK